MNYDVNATVAKNLIMKTLKAGLVPFVQSQPGIGKSQIVKQIAEEWNCKIIDVRLSTCTPEDLTGLPKLTDTEAKFVPFNIFPTESYDLGSHKGVILFLDEFNSCSRSVAAAAYRLVLDREVGQYKLHPKCAIVCAGNRTEDNAITTELGTALTSRLIHIYMKPDLKVWLEEVAYPNKYDPRIMAFLSFNKDNFCNFDPEAESSEAYACPRTWEFANKLIYNRDLDPEDTILLSGTLGGSVATDFIAFTEVFKEIPDVKEIVSNPESVELVTKQNIKYALVSALISQSTVKNIENIITYLDRYNETTLMNLYLKAVRAREPKVLQCPKFTQAVMGLGKALRNVLEDNF